MLAHLFEHRAKAKASDHFIVAEIIVVESVIFNGPHLIVSLSRYPNTQHIFSFIRTFRVRTLPRRPNNDEATERVQQRKKKFHFLWSELEKKMGQTYNRESRVVRMCVHATHTHTHSDTTHTAHVCGVMCIRE